MTKFISRNHTSEDVNLRETADNFVQDARAALSKYEPSCISNIDQSGFQKEMHGGLTLEFIGAKRVLLFRRSNYWFAVSWTLFCLQVEVIGQSLNALTHSYTILPAVSMDGDLLPMLLIVLQECNGQFGPRIQPQVDVLVKKCGNVHVLPSRSSIMSKMHLHHYFKNVFSKYVTDDSALLLDSWPTYRDTSILDECKQRTGHSIEVLTIPPKTTGMIQPLDVYGFRPWKNLHRTISDKIMLDQIDRKYSIVTP